MPASAAMLLMPWATQAISMPSPPCSKRRAGLRPYCEGGLRLGTEAAENALNSRKESFKLSISENYGIIKAIEQITKR